MTTIDVLMTPRERGWTCRVTVRDSSGTSSHEVRVTPEDLARYGSGTEDPEALVRRSFEFLLEREPRGAILRSFDLSEIERYFPEYPEAIRHDV
jgi:hypothetical protein